jgi:hypothetical protein
MVDPARSARLTIAMLVLLAPSFATYFGGTGDESGARLALDPNGTLHVAGTSSGAYLYRLFDHSAVGPFATADFPILNAAQPGFAGGDGSTAIAIGDPFLMTDAVVFSIGQDLTVTAQPVRTVVGEAYTQAVATFTAPDPTAPASNFTAEINWGDGAVQPDFGTVRKTGDPSAPFEVVGNHTYARPGSYPVVVTVTDIKYNIRATTAYDVSQARNNQSETNIAVDPNDAHRVFAVANDFLNLVNDNSNLFAGFSADGGITWTSSARAGVLTPAAGADPLPAFGGDPRVVFDQFGNLYLTALRRDHNVVVVLLSADGGKTFRLIGEFPSQGGASGAAGEDPEQAAVDQPSIAVGPGDLPGTGSVWISYADVNADTVFAAGARVTGLGQVGDFQLIDLAHGQLGNFGNIAVGPAGQVVATWQNFGSDATKAPPDAILVSSNPDGLKAGASFSPPVVLSPIPAVGFGYVIPPQATRNIAPDIRLAWDKSGGPHNGRLYLAYTDALAPTAAPNDTDIFERHSDDGGATWSEPVKVNDDAGGHSQFFASIAVDQSTGDFGVAWYDARNSATNTQVEVFAAVSIDSGQSVLGNVQVATALSSANAAGNNAGNDYGDYTANSNVMEAITASADALQKVFGH